MTFVVIGNIAAQFNNYFSNFVAEQLLIRFIYLLIAGSIIMAYSWDNRVKFIVRYMYDIDNNGFLDKNDFECLAVRNTVIETKVSVPY